MAYSYIYSIYVTLVLLSSLSEAKRLRRRMAVYAEDPPEKKVPVPRTMSNKLSTTNQGQQVYLTQHPHLCVSHHNEDMVLATCDGNSDRQHWTFVDGNHWWSTVDGLGASIEKLEAGAPLKLKDCKDVKGEQRGHFWHFNKPNDNGVRNDITPFIVSSLCVGHNGGQTPKDGDRLVLKECDNTPTTELAWGFRVPETKPETVPPPYNNVNGGPTNLVSTATLPPNVEVNLAWTDNSINEDGFEIKRRQGTSGNWHKIATVARDVRSFTDTTVREGYNYQYKIRAFRGNSYSIYSNVDTVFIHTGPGPAGPVIPVGPIPVGPNPVNPGPWPMVGLGDGSFNILSSDVQDVGVNHAMGQVTMNLRVGRASQLSQYRYCYHVSPQLVSAIWNDIRHSSYLRINNAVYRPDLNCNEISLLEVVA